MLKKHIEIGAQAFQLPGNEKSIIGYMYKGESLDWLEPKGWKMKDMGDRCEFPNFPNNRYWFTFSEDLANETADALDLKLVIPDVSLIWYLNEEDVNPA